MSSKRSRIPARALGWSVGSIAALGALLGPLARPAEATLAVYADENGQNQGVVELDTVNPNDLRIWIDKPDTTPSLDACSDVEGQGEGDEICGYDVLIEIQGPGCFTGTFAPGSGAVVYHPTGVLSCETRQLHAALVDAGTTSNAPLEIGTLTVDAGGTSATRLVVLGKNVVAADLTLEEIPSQTIAQVPEPAELVLLASGIAGLAGLQRLRKGSPRAG